MQPTASRVMTSAAAADGWRWADKSTTVLWSRPGGKVHMRLLQCGLFVVVLLSATSIDGAGQQSQTTAEQSVACPVTKPNEVVADGGEPNRGSFGNSKLSVGPFGLWPDGTVVLKAGGSGFVTPEGWLGMKFGFQRSVHERLTVEGRRLDGPAPALLAESAAPTATGFQATALIFATPGCWEVTARAGVAVLTFVTRVEKIGDGPAWRRSHQREKSIVPMR